MKRFVSEFIEELCHFYLMIKLKIKNDGVVEELHCNLINLFDDMIGFFKKESDGVSEYIIRNFEDYRATMGTLFEKFHKVENLLLNYYPIQYERVKAYIFSINREENGGVCWEAYLIFLRDMLVELSEFDNFNFLNEITIEADKNFVAVLDRSRE